MVIALDATSATLGLVGVFFVFFPLLAHGLIGYAAAQAAGERRQNQAYRDGITEDEPEYV